MKSLVTFEGVKYRFNSPGSGRNRPRCHPPPRLEVMIRPGGPQPALPTTGERADEHGGLGIQGQTKRVRRPSGVQVNLVQVLKDRIGLLQFFWGLDLVTERSRNPKSFSLVVIVWTDGTCRWGYPLRSINCRRTSAADTRQ